MVAFFLLAALPRATGQSFSFRQLTVENGLSQNAVMSIAQDKQGFMWYGTRYGLNRYDGIRFKTYKSIPGDSSTIPDNIVNALLTDHEGTLWVGTLSGLCRYNQETDAFERVRLSPTPYMYVACLYEDAQKQLWAGTNYGLLKLADKKTKRFVAPYPEITLLHTKGNMVRSIYRAADGKLWAGTSTALVSIQPDGHPTIYRHDEKDAGSISADYITCIVEDNQRRLWIGTQYGGLNRQNADGSFTRYRQPGNTTIGDNIRKILPARDGSLWVGTQDGISIIDPGTLKTTIYRHDPEKKTSLSNNSVHTLYQDNCGTVWIGTYHGGINFLYSYTTPFNVYQNNRLASSISSNVISSVVEDAQHNLWIGTEGGGLNYFNRQTGTFSSYKNEPGNRQSISSNLVKIVYKDRSNRLWIGTSYGNGLNLYNPSTHTFQHISLDKEAQGFINFDEILAILETTDGTLWIGAQSGLTTLRANTAGQYPNRTSPAALNNQLPNRNIHALLEDSRHHLWIGTAAGVFISDPATNQLVSHLKKEGHKDSLQADGINCITEDSKGHIWLGTFYGGASRYDPATHRFTTYTDKSGLPNNNVLGIVEDKDGMIWLSTDNGLARLNPQTQECKVYTTSDGMAGNKFSNNSFFRDSKGLLYFGGNNGLTVFDPASLQTNTFKAPVRFTSLDLAGNPVAIQDNSGLLSRDIGLTSSLEFNYDQNNFTLNWAMLNFIKPEKNRYAYMLEGFDKQWNYTNNASATYSNLPAGRYTLLVKGANNDGIWSDQTARMSIRIWPPIWKTWYAYLFYILVAGTLIFLVLRFLWLRTLFRKEHELHQFKLNFFTNISHEIRTHLTLINGPVEKLLQQTNNNGQHRQLEHVKNSADRLTQLVGELMDFRKAETNNLPLHLVNDNIVLFTEAICNSFADLAAARNIELRFEAANRQLAVYFDGQQMAKVIFNLLTNAFKFTPDGGRIKVSVEDNKQEVLLHVSDNGRGIAPENIKKLFANFFQVADDAAHNTGYGIGLALSKSIVELHKGTLTVSSRQPIAEKEGNTVFTISLPRGHAHINAVNQVVHEVPLVTQVPRPVLPMNESALLQEERPSVKPLILLVEDNAELRLFIRESLSETYTVLEALDGGQGWETAIGQMPELIISDVMMPGKDGFTLCRELKQDIRTSHIPVILLTAKAGQENQVEGLTSGADAYITKPFSLQILELQARNLIAGREAMREKFGRQLTEVKQAPATTETPVPLSTADHDFMNRLLELVDEYMDDPSFNVGLLATKMLVSAPVLYKKVKALTDMTVNDFVKSLRLKKAAALLQQGEMNISEVAYAVGFNRRKYFSEEFKKMYGKTPSDFADQESGS